MSNSVQPHRRQPTRLPRPWDSPGKNTGVGRHFLLQCIKVKRESEVAQLCPIPSNPMDCSLPGSSIHGICQARVLEWGAIAFSQKNIYFCFIDYAKAFDCVDHNKAWKILKEMGIPDCLAYLLRNLYAGQEATVRLDMEQQTGSKLGKEYVKAVYCHPAYLTYMQSTSCKVLGWESRLLGEISITSDMQMTPPLWQKVKRN